MNHKILAHTPKLVLCLAILFGLCTLLGLTPSFDRGFAKEESKGEDKEAAALVNGVAITREAVKRAAAGPDYDRFPGADLDAGCLADR